VAESAAQGALLAPRAMRAAEATDVSSADALGIRGVTKSFGATSVLTGVDLTVRDGEVVCLIGPNGAGKTTLLNIVGGDLAASGGTIEVFGRDVSRKAIHERSREGVGKVFQIPSVFADLTAAQNMQLARAEALTAVPLPEAYRRFVDDHTTLASELPLADRRALELAMVLAWGPRVILLDEPAAGLSHEESVMLARRLREVADETGCTLVIVEHDMEIVRELADRVVVLAAGSLLVDGSMDDVSANEDVRRAYLGAS